MRPFNVWWSSCPFCPHTMMHHDGDGATEHFSCCEDDCDCRWEWTQAYPETGYEPVKVGPAVRTPITPITSGAEKMLATDPQDSRNRHWPHD